MRDLIRKFEIRNSKFEIDLWMVVSLFLAGVLVVSLSTKFLGAKLFHLRGGRTEVRKERTESSVLVTAMDLYKDFVCFCCGQNIGECTCGEAEEKRKVVDSLVGEGQGDSGKRKVYKKMIKKYGEEILFNKAMAAELKKEMIAEAPAERPIIAIEPETLDLGDVPKTKVISRDFKIKNEGKQDLVINNLESSCECTSAQVINQEIKGPIFGMEGHSDFKNPKGWSTTIVPGGEAILRIFYDPKVHPDLKGPVTRVITVFSNDPINSKIKATIELNQVE